MRWTTPAAIAALTLALGAPGVLRADVDLPSPDEIDESFAEGKVLTGYQIYQRFLHNRFKSSLQRITVESTDPSGAKQRTRMLARWMDYRAEGARREDGVIAKTLVRIEEPFDLRRTTYLLIARKGKPHEQFVYLPEKRRVQRIWLRGIGLLGTDYTLDDLVFQTIEDAEYRRLPDAVVQDVPVFVVEAHMKSFLDSQYEWITVYLHREKYVMLRAVYHDDHGNVIRELRADVDSIDYFEGVWFATASTMFNLREGTRSTLTVHHLLPNADFDDRDFSNFSLGIHH